MKGSSEPERGEGSQTATEGELILISPPLSSSRLRQIVTVYTFFKSNNFVISFMLVISIVPFEILKSRAIFKFSSIYFQVIEACSASMQLMYK